VPGGQKAKSYGQGFVQATLPPGGAWLVAGARVWYLSAFLEPKKRVPVSTPVPAPKRLPKASQRKETTGNDASRKEAVKARLKAAIALEPKARAKVLTAAITVFRKKGVGGCTVEDLLQTGTVSRGSFYQYFQSKFDVAAALFRHLQQILVEMTRTASAGEREPLTRLQNAFQVYMQLQIDVGWLYAMLMVEAKQPTSPLAAVREEVLSNAIRLIDRTMRDLQGRALEPDVYCALILTIEELTLRAHQQGTFKAADAERIRSVMLPIVQRTLARPGESLLELPVVD